MAVFFELASITLHPRRHVELSLALRPIVFLGNWAYIKMPLIKSVIPIKNHGICRGYGQSYQLELFHVQHIGLRNITITFFIVTSTNTEIKS